MGADEGERGWMEGGEEGGIMVCLCRCVGGRCVCVWVWVCEWVGVSGCVCVCVCVWGGVYVCVGVQSLPA